MYRFNFISRNRKQSYPQLQAKEKLKGKNFTSQLKIWNERILQLPEFLKTYQNPSVNANTRLVNAAGNFDNAASISCQKLSIKYARFQHLTSIIHKIHRDVEQWLLINASNLSSPIL